MNKMFIFLNNLKNAALINKDTITIEHNSFLEGLAYSLYSQGLIQSYLKKKIDYKVMLIVVIRYYGGLSYFTECEIIFKKKKKNYFKNKEMLFLKDRKKTFFFSTKLGIMTTMQCKFFKVGGTLLFSC